MKQISRIWISALLALVLALAGIGSAAAESGPEVTGVPFPDFTVTDTEGNTFTLSEALKGCEAVLVSLWEAPCPSCGVDLPSLQAAWEKYGDRVAVLALFAEPEDRMESIAALRKELGVTFPMASGGEQLPAGYTGRPDYPVTVVVDRSGNTVFFREGLFRNPEEAGRILAALLGEENTEDAVPEEILKDSSTRAFPVPAGENTPKAYILRVVDQDDRPVEEAAVTFCTDTSCLPLESDENGLITFDGAPGTYHVQIIDAPEGYSYDEDFELYTPCEYEEWVLRIRKG